MNKDHQNIFESNWSTENYQISLHAFHPESEGGIHKDTTWIHVMSHGEGRSIMVPTQWLLATVQGLADIQSKKAEEIAEEIAEEEAVSVEASDNWNGQVAFIEIEGVEYRRV